MFLFLPPLVLPLSIKEFFCQFDFARRMLPPSLSSPEWMRSLLLSLSAHCTRLPYLKFCHWQALNCHLCFSLHSACLQSFVWCKFVKGKGHQHGFFCNSDAEKLSRRPDMQAQQHPVSKLGCFWALWIFSVCIFNKLFSAAAPWCTRLQANISI